MNIKTVIYDIERCTCNVPDACRDCSRFGNGDAFSCMEQLLKDALAVLKKQEPVMLKNQHKPYGNSLNANAPWISRCPKCGKKIEGKQTRYCKYCGQAVRWE